MTSPAHHPILVVDDEHTIRLGFSVALRASGFEVALAADGTEALERARATPPSCVLLDLRMPGLNGLETAAALRAQGSHCPIVLATAFADHATAVAAIGAGITDFLTKPIKPTQLRYAINHALSRHARFSTAPHPSPAPIPPGLQRAYAKYCLSQGRRAEATAVLTQLAAPSAESNDLQSLLLLGTLHELDHHLDRAAEYFLRAAELHAHHLPIGSSNDLFRVFSHSDSPTED